MLPGSARPSVPRLSLPWRSYVWALPLVCGILAIAIPTFLGIAQVSWSTEQGAHGPIVLAIGLWLLARKWSVLADNARPGNPALGWSMLAIALIGYMAARLVGSITIESAMMYAAFLATLHLFVGASAMRMAWFPLAFLLFVLPPPGSVVAAATQPLRLEISQQAVNFLAMLGYPVARAGLIIYVNQYVLEVKAACGGLNSIISLTAIGLFYAYIRHNSNARYVSILFFVIVAMAIAANFVRVLILILTTYYLGDRAAQGFLHQFAGLTMFTVVIGGIIVLDHVAGPLRRSLEAKAV
ncbi:exosortase [bacterium]|nr:MAG: exosortase [bacterium]